MSVQRKAKHLRKRVTSTLRACKGINDKNLTQWMPIPFIVYVALVWCLRTLIKKKSSKQDAMIRSFRLLWRWQ